jgi:hypothetical protein
MDYESNSEIGMNQRNGLITKVLMILLSSGILLISCCKEDEPEPEPSNLSLSFEHYVDGNPLVIDSMVYTNTAGNEYLVTEVQYFISDVILYKSDGTRILIEDWEDIHYVDNDIPSTMLWEIYDDLPAGKYDSISFTFGIPEAKNHSLMFVNPPERDMFWPEFLGGGYHHMKLNGKWLDVNAFINSFDLHLGTGQIYASNVVHIDSIIGFVPNDFRVSLTNSSFTLEEGKRKTITLRMNIESWFDTPNIYDLDNFGGYIMQNQQAMSLVRDNGWDVFSVKP